MQDPEADFIPEAYRKQNSMKLRVRTADNDELNNPLYITENLFDSFCQSIGLNVFLLICGLVSVTLIVLGGIYLDNCPIDKKIPLWMMVFGSVGFVSVCIEALISNHEAMKKRQNSNYETHPILRVKYILDIFNIAWFVAGNVWVFQVRDYVDYKDANKLVYCHRGCFLFSYWFIITVYILIGLACCALILNCIFKPFLRK